MKQLLLLLLWIISSSTLCAQEMKQLFINLPDSIAPLLTKVNREDCVDFLDSNMKAEVKNRFGNPSELKLLTADYLLLQMTAQSTLQLKLLPLNDSVKVVCAIFTACAPACDSDIRFYTTDWKGLNRADFLSLPAVDYFFVDAKSKEESFLTLKKELDMELFQATFSLDKQELLFQYTTPDYLVKEEREKLLPYLIPTGVVYLWQDGKFHLSHQTTAE